jgi:hypothetical protein
MTNNLCELCKKEEATNHSPALHICDKCFVELNLSFQYYIGGREVPREEYKRKTKE